MNFTKEKIGEIYSEVMRAATTDEEFRAALLTDPKGAIKKLTGAELPEGFRLKILEEDPDYDMTILLPPMISDELSGEEAEQVAGGARPFITVDKELIRHKERLANAEKCRKNPHGENSPGTK